MQLFQILGSAAIITVFTFYMYKEFANTYYTLEFDKYGRRHKRDIRNGRFVKVK